MRLDHRSAEWFREQAERCKRLVPNLSDDETAERFRSLAEEYTQQARRLDIDQTNWPPSHRPGSD